MSGMAPVSRFARPRTLAMTFCGEFGPPKKAPPSLENRADSPPPAAPSEDATIHAWGGTERFSQSNHLREDASTVVARMANVFFHSFALGRVCAWGAEEVRGGVVRLRSRYVITFFQVHHFLSRTAAGHLGNCPGAISPRLHRCFGRFAVKSPKFG